MVGVLFFFAALGAFNGVLLGIYLLFITKNRTLPKYLLGGLVMALSIRIGKSVFLYFDPTLSKAYLQVGMTACFFIGLFLWFYTKAVRNELSRIPRSWVGLLFVYIVLSAVIGWLYPYTIYPDYWNDIFIKVIYVQWLLLVIMSGYVLRDIIKKAARSRHELSPGDNWLLAIYTANVLISAVYFAAFLGASSIYYISGPLIFSLVLYLMIFGYFYKDTEEFAQQRPLKRYANKEIQKPDADRLLRALDHLMSDQKIYEDANLNLKGVAELMNIRPHRLSQLLNDNLGKSYSTYIHERRIEAACTLIATEHQLSLEGIGYEVGYQVKSTFFAAFKKVMGMTPASYKQSLSPKDAPKRGS